MKSFHPALVLCLLLLAACKKNISNPVSDQAPTTFSEVFEDFWTKMSINYLYWNVDTTDWNAVHDCYQPLFAALQLGNPTDQRRSVQYFREMTDGLIDHHYSITFTLPALKDSSVNPAVDQLLRKPDFRNPYSFIGLDQRYLDAGFFYGTDNKTNPTTPLV